MLLIAILGIVLIVLGGIAAGLYILYKKGKRVWKEKKLELNILEKTAFKWFYLFEDLMGPKRNLKANPVNYLLGVYDYIAIRTVDLESANRYLRRNAKNIFESEDAVFYIKDYWNSPFGRLFSIVLEKSSDDIEHEIIYPLEFLSSKINKMGSTKPEKPEKPENFLRVVK